VKRRERDEESEECKESEESEECEVKRVKRVKRRERTCHARLNVDHVDSELLFAVRHGWPTRDEASDRHALCRARGAAWISLCICRRQGKRVGE
jgi:hypothetical protein